MIEATISEPVVKNPQVRLALRDLRKDRVIATSGMFFLWDLDLEKTDVLERLDTKEDSKAFLDSMKISRNDHKSAPKGRATITEEDEASAEFPIGKTPTFEAMRQFMLESPLRFICPFVPLVPTTNTHIDSHIARLFILFSQVIWSRLSDNHRPAPPNIITVLDALSSWSLESVDLAIMHARYDVINALPNPDGQGVQGRRAQSFADRFEMYFPDSDDNIKPNSRWGDLTNPLYYLYDYWGLIVGNNKHKEPLAPSDLALLRAGLRALFDQVQCLPDSKFCTKNESGYIWHASGQDICFVTNPRYYRIQGVRPSENTRPALTQRRHIAASSEAKALQTFLSMTGLRPIQVRSVARLNNKRKKLGDKNANAEPGPTLEIDVDESEVEAELGTHQAATDIDEEPKQPVPTKHKRPDRRSTKAKQRRVPPKKKPNLPLYVPVFSLDVDNLTVIIRDTYESGDSPQEVHPGASPRKRAMVIESDTEDADQGARLLGSPKKRRRYVNFVQLLIPPIRYKFDRHSPSLPPASESDDDEYKPSPRQPRRLVLYSYINGQFLMFFGFIQR